ncbi:terpenoid synthase [Pseudovirgaria hyperparasitica]|uniref:Terpene synthase n=1 Tax=Pseudovirgaria hyperparasitica TaxID=470096 RepID=A0A6A6W1T9_9PEZI|nr:terpenoid synthase [Pseudovirgaria hyperparasitica]KAF2756046.1 terpenoid synthase [Pseudovirgaria hyperparasitica]
MPSINLSREQVLEDLRGQTIHIPNLLPIFADWRGASTVHVSTFVDELRVIVTERLRRLYTNGKQLKTLESADFALFTALWWPDAPLNRLRTLAFLIIWLFTWDDEIDTPTGFCSDDFGAAQRYREKTLEFVAATLGLSASKITPAPRNAIIQSFDVVGDALRTSYSLDQRRRFYREIFRFMIASEDEQRLRLDGTVPTLEQYWQFRLGTSAVYIGVAVGEFSLPIQLPQYILENHHMQGIWDETNVIISIINDLLSLRKEIKQGCIDSIVPLTFARCGDLQIAVSKSVAALRMSKDRFDLAAQSLVMATAKEDVRGVRDFIDVCKSNSIGNLVWRSVSLLSPHSNSSRAIKSTSVFENKD